MTQPSPSAVLRSSHPSGRPVAARGMGAPPLRGAPFRLAAALALLGWAASCRAHVYPMHPAQAELRVDGQSLVLEMTTHSVFWIEEVLPERPEAGVAVSTRNAAALRTYLDSHFVVSAGGKAVPAGEISARFLQRPWEILEDGRLELRTAYPIASADKVSVRSTIFLEYHEDQRIHHGRKPEEMEKDFATLVYPGAGGEPVKLVMRAPEAELSRAALTPSAARTAVRLARAAWRRIVP